MPQPLYFKAKDANVLCDISALDHRPELAILIAKVVSAWAQLEGSLGNLLARMIDAQSPTDIDQYDLSSMNRIFDALDAAAAKAARKPEYLELYQAIRPAITSLYKRRNAIAHRIWCYSDDVPDGLILTDPDDLLQFTLAFNETIGDRDAVRHLFNDLRKTKMLVYYRSDFEKAITDILTMSGHLVFLGFVLSPRWRWPDEQYQRLCNEPDIQAFLSQWRERQKNNP